MAFFNRNKTNQAGMAPEVRDYYQAEGRERTWVAWLMALVTLLVTIFVVLGLFYGGRWVFRKFKNNNKPTPVAVQTEAPKTDESKPNNQPASTDALQSSNKPTTTTPTTTSTPSTPPTSTPTSEPVTSSTSPTSSSNSKDLPNTGPGDVLAIFAAVSVLGYLAHRRFLTKI